MPTYEHRCLKCNHEFEHIRPMKEYNIDPMCPECGYKTKRLISVGATHGDEAPWIDSTNIAIWDSDSHPEFKVTNRTEYKRRLKEYNLEPIG